MDNMKNDNNPWKSMIDVVRNNPSFRIDGKTKVTNLDRMLHAISTGQPFPEGVVRVPEKKEIEQVRDLTLQVVMGFEATQCWQNCKNEIAEIAVKEADSYLERVFEEIEVLNQEIQEKRPQLSADELKPLQDQLKILNDERLTLQDIGEQSDSLGKLREIALQQEKRQILSLQQQQKNIEREKQNRETPLEKMDAKITKAFTDIKGIEQNIVDMMERYRMYHPRQNDFLEFEKIKVDIQVFNASLTNYTKKVKNARFPANMDIDGQQLLQHLKEIVSDHLNVEPSRQSAMEIIIQKKEIEKRVNIYLIDDYCKMWTIADNVEITEKKMIYNCLSVLNMKKDTEFNYEEIESKLKDSLPSGQR